MKLTIDQALQKAIEAHKMGNLRDAERLYRAILHVQPQHPYANHNLGLLAVAVGQPQEALPYLKCAHAADRSQRQFWVSYINALIEAKQLKDAAELLEEGKKIGLAVKIIAQLEQELNPQPEQITPNRSPKQHQTSRIKKAGKAYAGEKSALLRQLPSQQRIDELLASYNARNFDLAQQQAQAHIKAYPNHALGWKVLAAVFKSKGRLHESLESMRQSVKLAPHDAEAHYNLGIVLRDLGRLTDAEACYREAIRLKSDYAQAHSNLGVVLKELGRLTDAEASYREAIRQKLDYAQAHSNLGVVLKELGRLTDAEASYREAIRLNPDLAEAHYNLGNALKDLERTNDAEASFREAIRLKPDFTEAHSNLGNALKELGRLTDAEASYREAIRLKPDFVEAYCNLGSALKDLGRVTDAEASYREAIRLKPDYAEAHSNLGNALKDLGRLTEAEGSYREAIRLKPDYAQAHGNLGNALCDLGRLTDAEASYLEAIRLKPDFAEAHSNLGNALKDLGRLTDAEASYREAIRLKPDYAQAHSNLGNALYDLGRLTDAEASYREAIRLKPDYAQAHGNLGNALYELGRLTDAETSFREAIRLQPDAVESLYKLLLLLPDIYDSQDTIEKWRRRYASGLIHLIDKRHELHNPAKVAATHTFNLAYHNQSNVQLMTLRSQLVRAKVKECNYVAPHISDWKQPKNRKIRIAFCSQFLSNHTIGKLYQGIVKQLDREIFEVFVIHASTAKRDEFSYALDKTADKVLYLNPVMTTQLTQISNQKLDVLFYPDIGMHPETFYLAHARLAPIQVVSWGHPDTTGIDTLDYFISSSLIELGDADHQYTERLIRLGRLPSFYQPLFLPSDKHCRASMGLSEQHTLYGCPQSLFKIHPNFDVVLAEIINKDPKARIVMIEGSSPAWSVLLRERWANSCPSLNQKVTFIPRQPLRKFMSLMATIDVLLDPIYFGSGNTMYESLICGTPIVTWQGRFMRGRIVAGAYKQMLIKEAPIAAQLIDYAPLAVELGDSYDKRISIKKQILNNISSNLFSDHQVISELQEFLVSAIEAADKGEKLPIGWTPSSGR